MGKSICLFQLNTVFFLLQFHCGKSFMEKVRFQVGFRGEKGGIHGCVLGGSSRLEVVRIFKLDPNGTYSRKSFPFPSIPIEDGERLRKGLILPSGLSTLAGLGLVSRRDPRILPSGSGEGEEKN